MARRPRRSPRAAASYCPPRGSRGRRPAATARLPVREAAGVGAGSERAGDDAAGPADAAEAPPIARGELADGAADVRDLGLDADRAGHAESRGCTQDRARREECPGEDVDIAARPPERVGADLAAVEDHELDRVTRRADGDVAALADTT